MKNVNEKLDLLMQYALTLQSTILKQSNIMSKI
jgi:hypothetical protein